MPCFNFPVFCHLMNQSSLEKASIEPLGKPYQAHTKNSLSDDERYQFCRHAAHCPYDAECG